MLDSLHANCLQLVTLKISYNSTFFGTCGNHLVSLEYPMLLGYQHIGKICANGILRCIVSTYSV